MIYSHIVERFIQHFYDDDADIHWYHTGNLNPRYPSLFEWLSRIRLHFELDDIPHNYFVFLHEEDRLEFHRLYADVIDVQETEPFPREEFRDLTIPYDPKSEESKSLNQLNLCIQEEIMSDIFNSIIDSKI